MTTLTIDIETFSSVDIKTCGLNKYVESDDFEVMLFGYSFDHDEPVVVDLMNLEDIPEHVIKAIVDPKITKRAYNAMFERVCLSKHFGLELDPAQWECTMVRVAALSLPLGLDKVARALKLEVQKNPRGFNLIRVFSIPCKPTAKNGMRTRNYPHHELNYWEEFSDTAPTT